MKRRTAILALAAGLLTSAVTSVSAQSVRLIHQINQITPSVASTGETIRVKISNTDISLSSTLKQINPKLQRYAGRFPTLATAARPTKIFFTGATANSFVEGLNVTRIDSSTYSVRVPNGARSGPMRLQMGISSSISTARFTLATVGYTVGNLSQFNVISLKVDNVERLNPGQVIAAVAHTSPNVNTLDIGTTAGSHTLQVTLGIDAARPIFHLTFPPATAQPSAGVNRGFQNPIPLNLMLGGEYLASSTNAVSASGSSRTVSWQAVQIQANGSPMIHGFDFTYNSATGLTNFIHWIGDRPNVAARGTVVEPTAAQWGLNFPGVNLPLRLSNGSNYTTLVVNLPAASMLATDGLTYFMQ